jgi:hypothetical protein
MKSQSFFKYFFAIFNQLHNFHCLLLPSPNVSRAFRFRSCKKKSWFAYAISSKTQKLSVKPNTKRAPRPKLIISARRTQEKIPEHRKLSWVRILTRMVSVARKLSTREEFVRFGEKITESKVTNTKTDLCSRLGQDVGFRIFFLRKSTIRIE